ncbi:YbaB/EbfC family nucleoid-associated protein [Nonomuraea sp. NPDC000554]|uniref:YbaB/EbfC family nucleoid-associated protein n=1 Tax=Nonomuraea sp. NPDC000554 TaxID=3154259 RepID=UPI0033250C37
MNEFKQILGLDPDKLAADADRLFARMRDLRAEEVTVEVESPDRRVTVRYSGLSGVQGLDLDPRALRMSAAELAETILSLIHRARDEAEARQRESAAAVLDAGNALIAERQDIADRLRQAGGTLQENLRDAAELIARLHGSMRR